MTSILRDLNVTELHLNLAGFLFRLFSNSAESLTLTDAYRLFIEDAIPAEPVGDYEILSPDCTELIPIDPEQIVWSCETWRMGKTPAGSIAIEIHSGISDAWATVANLSDDFSSGSIRPLFGRQLEPSEFALNYPYDQAIIMNRLMQYGAGVLHASGIAYEGSAYLFAAPSETGKTTLARLWRDQSATILNDDRMILRMREGTPVAFPTPWHGDEPDVNPQMLPLRALFILEQAPENELLPLSPAEAVSHLSSCSVAPFYFRNGVERMLDLWTSVIAEVPCWRFRFTPDQSAVEMILRNF